MTEVQETRHATCVAIGGQAVLIEGSSGSGKSDLALRLIDRGATLISDDYTVIAAREGVLFATPPATIAGKIEVRGVGIVDIPHISGVAIAMIIDLAHPVDRMPDLDSSQIILGQSIPMLALSAFECSAPIKVERALARFGARQAQFESHSGSHSGSRNG